VLSKRFHSTKKQELVGNFKNAGTTAGRLRRHLARHAGASTWNPIEPRLVSAISKHWAGCPLRSYQTILNDISTTTTTGLRVTAHLVDQEYLTGDRIFDVMMATLHVDRHTTQPLRNYTIHSRT